VEPNRDEQEGQDERRDIGEKGIGGRGQGAHMEERLRPLGGALWDKELQAF
jgi:hypothetical protein